MVAVEARWRHKIFAWWCIERVAAQRDAEMQPRPAPGLDGSATPLILAPSRRFLPPARRRPGIPDTLISGASAAAGDGAKDMVRLSALPAHRRPASALSHNRSVTEPRLPRASRPCQACLPPLAQARVIYTPKVFRLLLGVVVSANVCARP